MFYVGSGASMIAEFLDELFSGVQSSERAASNLDADTKFSPPKQHSTYASSALGLSVSTLELFSRLVDRRQG
jgi:hypothetical protein